MKSRLFLGVSALLLSFVMVSPAIAAFQDVSTSTQYRDAILYAESNAIVNGYPDGTFKPGRSVNRAEFTKIIVGAALNFTASPNHDFQLQGTRFSDVVAGEWYIPYLKAAIDAGIISGYPDGTFKPGSDISFVESSKIIVKGFGYDTASDAIWYKPFVEKLAELKAIPVSIERFDQKVTRAEMVEMIYRIKANIADLPSKNYAELAGTFSVSSEVSPMIGKCPVFPADNPWNTDISNYPLDPNSANYIASIGVSGRLHPDFGGNGEYGIPFVVVGEGQAKIPLLNIEYADESDPGPYPIPDNAPVENGSDAHVLVVDQDACKLYELFAAEKVSGGWNAGSAAIFDLLSNDLRPDGWTSADAAGLPIFPGLVRYNEAEAGAINHAIRFTVSNTQRGYIHPATHFASSSTDPNLPPMGLRLRMKADYDISGLTGHSLVIATAMKKFGMIVADNGSDWFFTGATDPRWDDDDLNQLKSIPGSAFEVVQTGEILR